MKSIKLTPLAESDLDDIWHYTLAKWGPEQAENYIRTLWSAVAEAADSPDQSVDISHIRKGYRKILSGSHVVFYRTSGVGIEVVRILHQKMDFDRHL